MIDQVTSRPLVLRRGPDGTNTAGAWIALAQKPAVAAALDAAGVDYWFDEMVLPANFPDAGGPPVEHLSISRNEDIDRVQATLDAAE